MEEFLADCSTIAQLPMTMVTPPDADLPQYSTPPAIVRQTDYEPQEIRFRDPSEQITALCECSLEEVHIAMGAFLRKHKVMIDRIPNGQSIEDQRQTIMQTRAAMLAKMEAACSLHWEARSELAAIALLSPWVPQHVKDQLTNPYSVGEEEKPLTRREKRALERSKVSPGETPKSGLY